MPLRNEVTLPMSGVHSESKASDPRDEEILRLREENALAALPELAVKILD